MKKLSEFFFQAFMLFLVCSILIRNLEQLNNRYNINRKQVKSVFRGSYSENLDSTSLGFYIEPKELSFSSDSDLKIQLYMGIRDKTDNQILYEKYFPFGNPSTDNLIEKMGKTFVVLPNAESYEFLFSYIYSEADKINFGYQSSLSTVDFQIDQNTIETTIENKDKPTLTIKFGVSRSTYVQFNEEFNSNSNSKYFTKVFLNGKDYVLLTMEDEIDLVNKGVAISEYQSKSSNDNCLFNSSPIFAELTFDKITFKHNENEESVNVRFEIKYIVNKTTSYSEQKIFDEFVTIGENCNFEQSFKDVKFRFELADYEYGKLNLKVTKYTPELISSFYECVEKDSLKNFIDQKAVINMDNGLFKLGARLTALTTSFVEFNLDTDNAKSYLITGSKNYDVSKSGSVSFKFEKNEKYMFLILKAPDDKLVGLNFYFKFGDLMPLIYLDGDEQFTGTVPINKTGDVSFYMDWESKRLGVLVERSDANSERDVKIQYLLGDDVENDPNSFKDETKKSKLSESAKIGIIVSAVLVAAGISIGIAISVRKCKKDRSDVQDSLF